LYEHYLGYLSGEVGEDPDHLKYEEYLERQIEKNEVREGGTSFSNFYVWL
jgi:hypothetical protein